MKQEKTVAVLGAGSAGLSFAKAAKDHGLVPTIIDKEGTAGGLWRTGGAMWNTMHTNSSKYMTVFSDFPWPDETEIYPNSRAVFQYLKDYATHFDLEKHFKLRYMVEYAKQLVDKRWELGLICLDTNERSVEVYDYFVVASGLHSKPRIPKFENVESFKGVITHSKFYQTQDEQFRDKNVIVAGSSLSAVEIAGDLVGHAKNVINVFKRPHLVIPRIMCKKLDDATSENEVSILTSDFYMLTRSNTYPNPGMSLQEIKEEKKKFFAEMCPDQTNKETSPPELYYDMSIDEPFRFAISDNYYPFVKQGKIKPFKTFIKSYAANGVNLDDGSFVECDAIVYCTGYDLKLDYFDKTILNDVLKYDYENYKNPIVLYKYTFHPELENAAFIGQYEGLLYAGYELQSRWVAKVFSGELSLPSKEKMIADVEQAQAFRKKQGYAPQFPFGPYVEVIDKLSNELNALPDFEQFNEQDPFIYNLFKYNLVSPYNFIYNTNRELSLKYLKEIDTIMKKRYILESKDDINDLKKLAIAFSKQNKLSLSMFKF